MSHIDQLIERGLANLKPFMLELVCRKCTRANTFAARNEEEAIAKAIEDGWVRGEDFMYFICPKCPVHVDGKGHRVA